MKIISYSHECKLHDEWNECVWIGYFESKSSKPLLFQQLASQESSSLHVTDRYVHTCADMRAHVHGCLRVC